jgi:predicted Ser/Thr protein kinase
MSEPKDNESDNESDGTRLRTQLHGAEGTTLRPQPEPPSDGTQLRTAVHGTQLRATRALDNANETAIPADAETRLSTSHEDMTQFELAQPPVQLSTGSVIKGRFLLEQQIGRGGMGLVFSAIDRRKQEARDPNPRIAMKVLYGDFQRHQDSLMALQREARKAQTLAHPNVVTVFDFDRDGPTVFITMELLRGRSLDTVIREVRGRGVGRTAALPIIRGIAEGLAYAHRKGIVHLDLKPGNVFVLEDGTPKLLDFGIARAVPSATAEKDVFDAGSLGAYTEPYATQEMVEGADPHPADDVYALALIACELLAGEHPYLRNSAPKARSLGLKPRIPKELTRRESRVLEAALAFDRSKRPKDAADFLSQFFGVTRLQKTMVAAVVTLAVLAGFFAYRDYRENSPTVAFEDLAPETQQQFSEAMSVGDTSFGFYERDRNVVALYDAVDAYADAYRLHPRNRKATRALTKAADALLEDVAQTPEQRKELATGLMQKSELLAKYEPVVEAAR